MGGFDTPPIHPETLFSAPPSGSKAENKNLFSVFDPLGGDIKKVSGSLKEPETTILLKSEVKKKVFPFLYGRSKDRPYRP